ncbi:hypothetical protein BT63DRAFT_441981 [Microthyrium microscopicum]|uniref:F-box domain-containing protein n=1 Tax=Microthyrium microscopicum TaxID=703497 RepID=A0A6A6U6N2_9PEZI|nr:hypothetical protein BT63DRAFT_441981 [Microthyrium microscopicum]
MANPNKNQLSLLDSDVADAVSSRRACRFDKLPVEILRLIIIAGLPYSVYNLMRVCKRFREVMVEPGNGYVMKIQLEFYHTAFRICFANRTHNPENDDVISTVLLWKLLHQPNFARLEHDANHHEISRLRLSLLGAHFYHQQYQQVLVTDFSNGMQGVLSNAITPFRDVYVQRLRFQLTKDVNKRPKAFETLGLQFCSNLQLLHIDMKTAKLMSVWLKDISLSKLLGSSSFSRLHTLILDREVVCRSSMSMQDIAAFLSLPALQHLFVIGRTNDYTHKLCTHGERDIADTCAVEKLVVPLKDITTQWQKIKTIAFTGADHFMSLDNILELISAIKGLKASVQWLNYPKRSDFKRPIRGFFFNTEKHEAVFRFDPMDRESIKPQPLLLPMYSRSGRHSLVPLPRPSRRYRYKDNGA